MMQSVWRFLKTLTLEVPLDAATFFLDIFLKELKHHITMIRTHAHIRAEQFAMFLIFYYHMCIYQKAIILKKLLSVEFYI